MHRIRHCYANFRFSREDMVLRDMLGASDDETDNDEAKSEVEIYPLFSI